MVLYSQYVSDNLICCHGYYWNTRIQKQGAIEKKILNGPGAIFIIHFYLLMYTLIGTRYATAHCQACFNLQGNVDVVSKIHCLTDQNKFDNSSENQSV